MKFKLDTAQYTKIKQEAKELKEVIELLKSEQLVYE